jgi:hypothetical protein
MSAERNTSSAFALLLSLDSKSVTIFAETRRITVPETCLPTFYTTHTKLSAYLCNRYEINHAHLLRTDHERFLRPHTLLRTSSSSSICHRVGPLVDPFRSHVSRSLFKGLPWFLLPVGEYILIYTPITAIYHKVTWVFI